MTTYLTYNVQVHGMGVFALRHYAAGEDILLLLGTYIPETVDDNTELENKYAFKIEGNDVVDGLLFLDDNKCNIGKYLNSCGKKGKKGKKGKPNCVARVHEDCHYLLILRAETVIRVGDELLLDYEC
jgi:hypothetical protein